MNEISLFLTSFHPSLKEDAYPLIRVIKVSINPPHKQETKTQLRITAEPNSSVQTGASGEVAGNRFNSPFLVQITEHHIHTLQEGGSLLIYSLF